MTPQKTDELYYSDSAIRERCLSMVYGYRSANPMAHIYYCTPTTEALALFNFVKTGETHLPPITAEDESRTEGGSPYFTS